MGRYRVASGGSEIADKRRCCDSKHNGKPDKEGRRSTKRRKSAMWKEWNVRDREGRLVSRPWARVPHCWSATDLVNPVVERVSSQLATEPVAFEHFSFGKLEKGWTRRTGEIFFLSFSFFLARFYYISIIFYIFYIFSANSSTIVI